MPGKYVHIALGPSGALWTLDERGCVWKQECRGLVVSQEPESSRDEHGVGSNVGGCDPSIAGVSTVQLTQLNLRLQNFN